MGSKLKKKKKNHRLGCLQGCLGTLDEQCGNQNYP